MPPESVSVRSSYSPSFPLPEAIDLQQQADRLVLTAYAPPGVIVNRDWEILHFRGDTSPFLRPSPGKASFHILKMAREGLLVDLRNALTQASRDGEPVIKSGLRVVQNEHASSLTLQVLPFPALLGDRYFLVLFELTPQPPLPQQETRRTPRGRRASNTTAGESVRLRQELAATREYLQAMIEEREATNEELQSANEEALSANEELQSINEELETAKEELQSSNEELSTLNEELQRRNLALMSVGDDLANVLTAIQIPILIVDRRLRIRRFTPAAATLLNLLPTDMGRPLTDMRLGVPIENFEHILGEVIETLAPVQHEVQIHEKLWYLMTVRPYQTQDRQIDGAVITFSDISSLKRSELRYRQLHEQGFATAEDAMVLLETATGRILEVNPHFTTLLGWTREELVGKPVWDVPVFRPAVQSEVAFRALTSVGYRRVEDVSFVTKADSRIDVDLVSTIYPAGDADVLQFSLHDLTERKRAETTLREANRSLVRINEDLQQFTYAASHDLREPLRQVSIYVQLLAEMDHEQLDAEVRQYVEYCLQGTRRMQTLLDDLSAYVRAGKAEGEPMPVDCNVVLQKTLENMQAAVAESGAVITSSLLPTVRAHEGHLIELFQNLLSNALKYRSEQTPAIYVSATQRDSVWVFAVRDDGIGIDPRYHSQIFGIFKRLHGQEYDGTGMGLAICQKIVERYGGRIWVESEAGKGATFFFTLSEEAKP
jgi:two-component system CheB/CheR fusion protein